MNSMIKASVLWLAIAGFACGGRSDGERKMFELSATDFQEVCQETPVASEEQRKGAIGKKCRLQAGSSCEESEIDECVATELAKPVAEPVCNEPSEADLQLYRTCDVTVDEWYDCVDAMLALDTKYANASCSTNVLEQPTPSVCKVIEEKCPQLLK